MISTPQLFTTRLLRGILFWLFGFSQIAITQEAKLNLYPAGFSDRNLLNLGDPRSSITKFSTTSFDEPDTLRILAIRVDFQEDNNSLTTGNGKFQLGSPAADEIIDPSPHDLSYFENQLLALSNYYAKVSKGKLILEGEVFPKDPQASYTVSQEMSFYAPVNPEELLDQRLAQLFQEGFQIADQTDNIDFSQYDCFILFHAGVGGDFAFDFDPTPQDIPSVFLDFNTLRENIGNNEPSYQGVSVNNGSFFIRDGILLPETQSQEGLQFGLLGTMAIMFGNQLGLPVLFNPDTGLPGIGVFGLMDQGSGNFNGLIPAEPCAWSKLFLGWETPIVIRSGEALTIASSRAFNENRIYKIPIDSKEYFLLENRNHDFDRDSTAVAVDANGARVEFISNRSGQGIAFEGQPAVITKVDEYDFGLPGSGILIWHIDERVIEANFSENRVNGDPLRRGIDLEEADGAQDIGQVYGIISPGAGSENGVIEDMFWGSNEINMLVNNSSVVAFTPTSTPRSLANSSANSHIFITDFSEPDSVMSFRVFNTVLQNGFPIFTGTEQIFTNSPFVADLNGDGQNEIVYSSRVGGKIFVSNSDGSKFIANSDSVEIEFLNGNSQKFATATFAEPPGELLFSPAVARQGNLQLVVAVTERTIQAYLPEDNDSDGRADVQFVVHGDANFTTPPLITDLDQGADRIVVGNENGEVFAYDLNGNRIFNSPVSSSPIVGFAEVENGQIAFTTENGGIGLLDSQGNLLWKNEQNVFISRAPASADLNNDNSGDIIAVSDQGVLFVFDDSGNFLQGFPKETGVAVQSQIALADLDEDDYFEIVFIGENKIYAFNHVGVLEQGFPIEIDNPGSQSNLLTFSSPVIGDIDGDSLPEIIVGSSANQLQAFHNTGERVNGFPLSTGRPVSSTAILADLDNDGDIELAATSDDGFLYVWDLPGSFNSAQIPWGGFLGDARHSNKNSERLQATPPASGIMPSQLVYNYPNPTDGNEITTIRYTLNETADVRIKIYDLAGAFVDELSGTGFPQTENEVDWSLDNIESGIYFAQVEALANNKREVTIIKIAVVK